MSENSSVANRRKFTRILFSSEATLSWGKEQKTVRLIDLSLNGALIELEPSQQPEIDTLTNLSITLDTDSIIKMEATVRHTLENRIGLHCEHFDLESATHLRRLVELNIGDDVILNRELSQLGT